MTSPDLEGLAPPGRSDTPAAPDERAVGRAAAMLMLTTLVWGLSFPLVKNWQDAARGCPGGEGVGSFSLIFLRMSFALLLLAAWRPGLFVQPTRREHVIGLVVGLAFFLGFGLQVLGMANTTPAMSAFFTCLGGAWVPLLVWVLFRQTAPRVTVFGIVLAVGGAAVLGVQLDEGIRLGWGDTLTLGGSLFFALQIVLLDRLGRTVHSAHVTVALMALCGLLSLLMTLVLAARSEAGLVAWLHWLGEMLGNPLMLLDLLVLTVFATVLAFHWMNTYQPQVGASRAALIYFLEPVFASIFSVAWGHDSVSLRLVSGGILIMMGNLLVEVPLLFRQRLEGPGET